MQKGGAGSVKHFAKEESDEKTNITDMKDCYYIRITGKGAKDGVTKVVSEADRIFLQKHKIERNTGIFEYTYYIVLNNW
ncbi:MAG: hypothetical protein QM644_19460 [Mobilitalea sp.]